MPSRTPYNQVRRILAILRILCLSPGPLNITKILDKLSSYDIDPDDRGQNPRSIHRDIAFLRDEMGYQIENKRGQGYFLHGKEQVLPIIFTKSELQTLCLGRELLSAFDGTAFGDSINNIYGKITAIYKKNKFDENKVLTSLEDSIIFHSGPKRGYKTKRNILEQIINAIMEQRVIKITYGRLRDKTPLNFEVKPLRLIVYNNSFYLLGLPVGFKGDAFRT